MLKTFSNQIHTLNIFSNQIQIYETKVEICGVIFEVGLPNFKLVCLKLAQPSINLALLSCLRELYTQKDTTHPNVCNPSKQDQGRVKCECTHILLLSQKQRGCFHYSQLMGQKKSKVKQRETTQKKTVMAKYYEHLTNHPKQNLLTYKVNI